MPDEMSSVPAPDLASAVVDVYNRRRRSVQGPEYHAWIAARDEVRRLRPDLDLQAAALLATQILALETERNLESR
ncbi:hypothetical protein [Arenibaculum pallidiluteum]|uniref:hypothetical protein n=1 Tax=Arenibaculum pallidiluteum TaxID=2812559 RepID=UPI001A959FFF|nr:hypothetical protein [Arenibaculum pallidiluteum]